jgi:hypothetical protein
MDNSKFISDLKVTTAWFYVRARSLIVLSLQFGAGSGMLNFYLYNWRTAPLSGYQGTGGVAEGQGVGVVML